MLYTRAFSGTGAKKAPDTKRGTGAKRENAGEPTCQEAQAFFTSAAHQEEEACVAPSRPRSRKSRRRRNQRGGVATGVAPPVLPPRSRKPLSPPDLGGEESPLPMLHCCQRSSCRSYEVK